MLRVIEERWPREKAPPLFSSFSLPSLKFMRRYSPSCLLGLLIREWRDDWQAISDALDCVTINVNQQILNPARAKAIKDTGVYCCLLP